MAQLSSPGVSVTVVDESFYTPGAPGTVPLIIVASKANKMNAAGTGIAPGTTAANAGKVWLLTSQMDLGSTFGIPYFQTDAANNPVNAGELNEYGLQAAYSFLGVSNRAYVVRADVDLGQLVASADAPVGKAADGTMWLDTVSTNFGLFEWNSAPATVTGGQSFVTKPVTVITDSTLVTTGTPLASYGQIGQYAVVATTTLFKLWYKKPITDTAGGVWVEVGSTNWIKSRPTAAAKQAISSITPGVAKTFTGAITSATLTVSVSVSNGPLANGDLVTFGGATPNTLILGQLTSTETATATVTYTSGGANGTSSFNVVSPSGLVNGQLITGTGVPAGTVISVAANTVSLVNSRTGLPALLTQQASGTYSVYAPGGLGTYTINQTYGSSVSATSMTVSTTGDTITINGQIVGGVSSVSALATAINAASITGVTAHADRNNYLYLYSTGTAVTVSGAIAALAGWTGGAQASATFAAPALTIAPHYTPPNYGTFDSTPRPTGSLWIKTTSVNLGANWIINKYNAEQDSWIKQSAKLFVNASTALSVLDPVGGGANLAQGALYVKYNNDEQSPALSNFKIYQRAGVGATKITSAQIRSSTLTSGSKSMTVSWSVPGSATMVTPVTVTFSANAAVGDAATFVAAFQAVVQDSNILAEVNSDNTVSISHLTGGEIVIDDGTAGAFAAMFPVSTTENLYNIAAVIDAVGGADSTIFVASLWTSTVDGYGFVSVSSSHPTTIPADQTLWYNSDITEVDIMVNNGVAWVGYLTTNGSNNYAVGGKTVVNGGVGGTDTDPNGPIVSATKPKKQSDGSALAHGDIWVSTADIGNFPVIYKYNLVTGKWVLVDNADQTTSNGIVFADARWSGAGDDVQPDSIAKLLTYNYVDPDAPDAALYPRGTLLWNLRRSGFNVKKFVQNYIDPGELNHKYQPTGAPDAQTSYYPHRWVSAAPNQLDGSGTFGTAAQRAVVLTGLLATIQENTGIRQPDTVIFNLLSCPGYLETYSALIGLNTDNGESAFIIADAPAHMTPDATTLSNWGNNTAGAAVDGDVGLIATNAYSAVYYPWAYTSDLVGNYVVVPPSHVMLRTIALSDNVSYPWFAPAGVRRGGVTNASSVGYVDRNSGEFITVALNGGQRDTLAGIHVNPITYLAGTGLVVYGQKTRQLVASSLDRINVARLVIFLRYQLNVIAKPFIFEPNDAITRNEIKQQIEKLLLGLTAQRALYDFLVVCDKSNNTPARIDANELHVDIAIEPVKSVEFIYIPMRLENTGGVAGLGA
jgi:Phage tail sheath C-terminal domain